LGSGYSNRPQSIAIIRAVTAMSISLDMKTTAEGVETEEELQTLKEEGCTEVQGYLFSKPERTIHFSIGVF
jgi:EAL domain-containing protein (putative c-di-GMP-specific phosphodiesterase class I)